MTATEVNGLAVVSDEPTLSPIRSKGDTPIYWHQTRTLTLADGTVVYGCAHCDYVRDNPNAIRPHLSKHTPRKPKPTSNGNAPADLTLNELIKKVAELDAIVADRDQWRQRAKDAEKRLRTLRNALGSEVNGRG